MNTKTWRVIWGITMLSIFVLANQSISPAQIKTGDNGVYMMTGSIDKDLTRTGFFNKNREDQKNQDWCIFISEKGQVYKLVLADKKVSRLFIDGQKIDDSQIEKHIAEYQAFLTKHLRSQEIENESRDLDFRIKPFDRKIETLDKEIEKLDRAEEKLEKAMEENSDEFAQERKNINAQQKKLAEMQRKQEKELEELSSQEEKLSNEQESLGLEHETDKILRQISEDLKLFGVIKNSTNLSFKLSNLELVVNGKKSSPEIFEKLKAKYIVDLGEESGFLFHWKWKY
jgi:bla regulator protein BlaR1